MVIATKSVEENNWGFGIKTDQAKLAGKLYGDAVKRVRKEVAKFDIQAGRLRKTFHAARSEADRSAAILMFALAEDLMLNGLKQHLQGEVKGGWNEVSSGNGLLATANDRITLLALLGWIHPVAYSDLRVLKAIRNRFAHHPDIIGSNEDKVRGYISALSAVEKVPLQTIEQVAEATLSPRQQYLIRAGDTLIKLTVNLAIGPIARQERVAPGHVEGVEWDQLPSNLQELYRICADHMLIVLDPSP